MALFDSSATSHPLTFSQQQLASMATPSPLTSLSPSVQNTKQQSPRRIDQHLISSNEVYEAESHEKKVSYTMTTYIHQDRSEDDEVHDMRSDATTSSHEGTANASSSNGTTSPTTLVSPLKKHWGEESSVGVHSPSSESSTHFNEGPTQKVESACEDQWDLEDTTAHRPMGDEGMSTIMYERPETNGHETEDETQIIHRRDDTMNDTTNDTMNDTSTFSATPDTDLTRFAALRDSAESPTRRNAEGWSPSKQLRNSAAAATPGTVKRPLQLSTRPHSINSFDDELTPRRPYSASSPEDLLNFTGQSNIFIPPPQSSSRTSIRRSPSGRGGFPIKINPSPTHRSQASVDRERSRGVISPIKQISSPPTSTTPFVDRRNNLLDFDLEPLATPRSIPSITPRELESMRSELSSKICSLSATLSGKEAEVLALKRSITDAEVRVGNTSEELRNEKAFRENLEEEKLEWDRRGREMENVLREIRQEIMIGEHERDKLRRQTEEAEKKAEAMEVRVMELQRRLETANRRSNLSSTSSPKKKADGSSGEPATPSINGNGVDGTESISEAKERVARDLHALYKEKHEAKVAALKKSYEGRWEKRVRQLEEALECANTEILNLKTERDATMSGPLAFSTAAAQQRQNEEWLEERTKRCEDLLRDREHMEANSKVQQARIEGLESEVQTVKHLTDNLREELEKERLEKGDLVAQVDLFLALGDAQPTAPTPRRNGLVGGGAGGIGESRLRSVSSDSIATTLSSSYSGPRPSLEYHATAPPPYAPPTTTTSASPTHPHQQFHHHHQQQQQQQQQQSPARPSSSAINGRAAAAAATTTTAPRARPMSMLQQPGKFSGIPGPGGVGARGLSKGLPMRSAAGGGWGGGGGGGGIMEGIAKMGGRGY